MNENTAILSSKDGFTSFSFGGLNVRFRTSDALERYTSVEKWDNGYIEVMAKYSFEDEPIEEYIDLIPILENLYIDEKEFLGPIENVRIVYD